ncbi:TPA: hypothetical protein ACQJO5_004473 [Vibrio parahaemolyticus]|uniref:hypothetical protein n=1 Tax=Vibrio parahaemolyticus TaxID=670 RepID=UPI000FEC7CB6|nr:hypothetical protein [Vibrio parahaemolyticus]EKA7394155.1 hypothetical protein [Vibrio parahaemolyticus]ELA7338535.1 hypothetical protein [Vibrio parahaemolyticus]ELB1140135.1 hypothetical protein [Vibrio parahaemolyticus]ELB2064155.1 hypothetical protein [Vibrio parahaemolyticus]MBE4210127.1 hypothetical protein [Vibrio parahaemolyticus]
MNKIQIVLVMVCMIAFGFMLGGGFNSAERHTINQGEGLPLFEVKVASFFPVKPQEKFNISTDSPITTFRVPLALESNPKLSFLSDFEVTIDNESGLVGRIQVERGFVGKNECIAALGTLVEKFQDHYPVFQFEPGKSNYSKTVGDLRADASCSVYEKSPYVSLEFYLESNSVADKILKAFTQR